MSQLAGGNARFLTAPKRSRARSSTPESSSSVGASKKARKGAAAPEEESDVDDEGQDGDTYDQTLRNYLTDKYGLSAKLAKEVDKKVWELRDEDNEYSFADLFQLAVGVVSMLSNLVVLKELLKLQATVKQMEHKLKALQTEKEKTMSLDKAGGKSLRDLTDIAWASTSISQRAAPAKQVIDGVFKYISKAPNYEILTPHKADFFKCAEGKKVILGEIKDQTNRCRNIWLTSIADSLNIATLSDKPTQNVFELAAALIPARVKLKMEHLCYIARLRSYAMDAGHHIRAFGENEKGEKTQENSKSRFKYTDQMTLNLITFAKDEGGDEWEEKLSELSMNALACDIETYGGQETADELYGDGKQLPEEDDSEILAVDALLRGNG
ncbi:hypothetical protein JCM8097_008866 [Rhodosporidiobolus ruineniae]